MKRLLLLAVLIAVAAPLAARPRAVRHPSQLRVMWIGAHPDDEILLSPLFGQLCVENGADCSMLVMTRGERGVCLLPGGCGDLGALRGAEMQSAAAALHARLLQWSFADVMTDVDATWSAEAGGRGELLARIAGAVAAERPDVVYTFDPAHGSTGHPAHRAIAQLVLDAIGTPRVRFVETAVTGFTFSAANAEATEIDATAGWHYLVDDARIHASQFSDADVAALANAPVKKMWVMDAR
jgi:LmbE family N-acetylglucosaminyl deacetylase